MTEPNYYTDEDKYDAFVRFTVRAKNSNEAENNLNELIEKIKLELDDDTILEYDIEEIEPAPL